jgi:hypothetical protein
MNQLLNSGQQFHQSRRLGETKRQKTLLLLLGYRVSWRPGEVCKILQGDGRKESKERRFAQILNKFT